MLTIPSRPRCSATRSNAKPSSKGSDSKIAGQPKRSSRVRRHLALHQRLQTKITAVEHKPIERPQVDCVRPCPTHVQSGEVRPSVRIAGYDLAVEHSRFGWELVQQLRDGREALGEVVPIAECS